MTAFCSLVYWENPVVSGAVFGTVLTTLMSMMYYSLIYVLANIALIALACVGAMKAYTKIVVMVGKPELAEGCPLDKLAELDVSLPTDNLETYSKDLADKLNLGISELRRLLLVESMMDTIKFGLSLWALTYIGAWFNAMTLIVLAWIAAFSVPKVYLMNQAKADEIISKVMAQVEEVKAKVMAIVPVKGPADKKSE